MVAPRIWIALGPLLTTTLGFGGADSGLRKRVAGIGYASYQGVDTYGDATSYLGIPYAEPPLGDLRFRAPKALDATRVSRETGGSVVDATQYPDPCIQGALSSEPRCPVMATPSDPIFTGARTGGDRGGAGSEDCLKVNIYTPSQATAGSNCKPEFFALHRSRRSTHRARFLVPVLFYIHGGGYRYGNPANFPFDHWVHQSQEVVIVSVYYRLSAFGFLSHPDFASGAIADNNVGFLDQVEALKWVKGYIQHFGGDPDNITINGESAGGASVLLHLVSTGGKVFKQAISQSLYDGYMPTLDQQKDLFDYFAAKAGCGTGNVAMTVACLREASVRALAIAQDAAQWS